MQVRYDLETARDQCEDRVNSQVRCGPVTLVGACENRGRSAMDRAMDGQLVTCSGSTASQKLCLTPGEAFHLAHIVKFTRLMGVSIKTLQD
jgi:hypothetical protein